MRIPREIFFQSRVELCMESRFAFVISTPKPLADLGPQKRKLPLGLLAMALDEFRLEPRPQKPLILFLLVALLPRGDALFPVRVDGVQVDSPDSSISLFTRRSSGRFLGREFRTWPDKLGLEKVYVQAKRWQQTVGRPEVQAFYGALAGRRANKGVFITTSSYTPQALEFARSVERVVLIDGTRLAQLMIDHEVGVTSRVVRVPKVDSDYFDEESA